MSFNIPEGYQRVTPYLIIQKAADFIEFTKDVFGAELVNKYMREEESLIMHGEIKIGDSVIMFADSTPQYLPQPAGFFIYVENADETYQKALDKGASSVTEVANQSYGRSGGVKDAFGNTWWITSVI